MNEILIFMGEHPLLTFFLALIIFGCIGTIATAIGRAIGGKKVVYKHFKCPNCGFDPKEDNDD